MTHSSLRRRAVARVCACLVAAMAVAACTTDGGGPKPLPAAPAGNVTGAPLAAPKSAAAAPPVEMAGRWTLTSTAGGVCGMTFGTGSTGTGTIAPEGGCPGNFYTSRSYVFDRGALVIRDHNGQPLTRLTMVSPVQFRGRNGTGQELTLSR